MNPLLILGPIGMLLVGILSIIYWKLRVGVDLKYFLWGGVVWFAAIIPKVVMDLTITPYISSWAKAMLGVIGSLVAIGVYVGLRTGVFECGFTYIVLSRKFRGISPSEATAFGIGFGAFEAIALAIPAMIQIVVFISNPYILYMVPPEYREVIETQLSMPTWVIFAPVIERVFTLIAHVFSTLMIYASITRKKLALLLGAVSYKSTLDAAIPYIQWAFKPSLSPAGMYQAEIWVVAMGLIAIGGIRLLKKRPIAPSGTAK